MKLFALMLPLALAACVGSDEIPDSERVDGVLAGTPIEVDGMTLVAQQMTDWPSMIAPIDAATGKTVIAQSGTADTVIISGSADDRSRAIRALAEFCNDPAITADGFDTQYVYQDPKTGDWWFDGFCG
ncbi:MAG TPA: hypothetical protein VK146_09275 [Tabrizicola sp.]|nr:hypothetical protein [Tabrizicola sp.]